MKKNPLAISFLTLALAVFSSAVFAQTQEEDKENFCQQWGLNIWGFSYHPEKNIDYNGTNWGAGVSCYRRPEWKWLGKSEDNRVFIQADTMINSYNGLLVLGSAGVEYKLVTISAGCKVFADAALTLAYYQNPVKEKNEVKFGPVPGVALGCGSFKSNVAFVPSVDKNHLAAIVASFTVLF